MSHYSGERTSVGGFLTDNTKKNLGDFLVVIFCAALVISALLGTAVVGKRLLFDGPRCIKHHQQVEQVDSYGKKEAITVCDQFQGEPAKVG